MFWNENASKTKMLFIIYRLKIFLLGYACIDPIIRRCYFIIILVLYNSYWMLQAGTSASNIVSFELVCQQNTRNTSGRFIVFSTVWLAILILYLTSTIAFLQNLCQTFGDLLNLLIRMLYATKKVVKIGKFNSWNMASVCFSVFKIRMFLLKLLKNIEKSESKTHHQNVMPN